MFQFRTEYLFATLSYSPWESFIGVSVPSCFHCWQWSVSLQDPAAAPLITFPPGHTLTHSTPAVSWAHQAPCLRASEPSVPCAGNTVPCHLMARCLAFSKGLSVVPTLFKITACPHSLLPFFTFLLLLFFIALLILYIVFIIVYCLWSVYTYLDVSPMKSGIFVLLPIHPKCWGQCLTSGSDSINIYIFESKLLTIEFRKRTYY